MIHRSLTAVLALWWVCLGLGPAGPLAPTPVRAEEDVDEERDFQKLLNERYPIEFRERVNAAIRRGRARLLATQNDDGSWPSVRNKAYPMGPTVLTILTLHKAGIPRSNKQMQKAWAFVTKQKLLKTYSVSILLMALDAKYAPARDPFEVVETDRYGVSKRKQGDDPCALTITKRDRDLMRRGVQFLVSRQRSDGAWRYPSGGFDLSNMQYALLGLYAAQRCKLKVPQEVWIRALDFLHKWQEPAGPAVKLVGNEVRGKYRITWTEKAMARGFRYAKKVHPLNGSMTTAGLAGLVICQNALWRSRTFRGKRRVKTRLGIRDALAWMQRNFEVRTNPREGVRFEDLPADAAHPNHYYYLYGLERAGILTRSRYMGEHDWYEMGAEYLIHEQLAPGNWFGPPEHTCFAILFLKRATARMRIPAITPSLESKPGK